MVVVAAAAAAAAVVGVLIDCCWPINGKGFEKIFDCGGNFFTEGMIGCWFINLTPNDWEFKLFVCTFLVLTIVGGNW